MDNLERIVTLTSMLFILPPLGNSTCVTHYLKDYLPHLLLVEFPVMVFFSINFVWLVSKIFFISFTNSHQLWHILQLQKAKIFSI